MAERSTAEQPRSTSQIDKMKIQPFCLGIGYTNCYVASINDEAVLIDAPDGLDKVAMYIKKEGLKLKAIILTHGHYDHILGLSEAEGLFPGTPIYIDKSDLCFLEDGGKANRDILSQFPGMLKGLKPLLDKIPAEINLLDDNIWRFRVIRTPGHTYGSVCLFSEEDSVLFSGDTLFQRSIGRSDLGGNYSDLMTSLQTLINTLPEKTLVLPGHGEFTSIEEEKRYNPYCR